MCASHFRKVLETPVTGLMERKGQLYHSVGLAQGYRNGIRGRQRWNVSPCCPGGQYQSFMKVGWLLLVRQIWAPSASILEWISRHSFLPATGGQRAAPPVTFCTALATPMKFSVWMFSSLDFTFFQSGEFLLVLGDLARGILNKCMWKEICQRELMEFKLDYYNGSRILYPLL